jgi:ketosteroid isomerase-like protein
MIKYRMDFRLRVMGCLLAGILALSLVGTIQARAAENEQTLWDLERAYWRYVQDHDLAAYRNLWHKDFLGWPLVSETPVHKDHITDWITSQTSQGLAFKSIEVRPAAIQVTGDIALTYYWSTYEWLDKNGAGTPRTTRVTHTWIKNGKDWQIIGGMSMPEATVPKHN